MDIYQTYTDREWATSFRHRRTVANSGNYGVYFPWRERRRRCGLCDLAPVILLIGPFMLRRYFVPRCLVDSTSRSCRRHRRKNGHKFEKIKNFQTFLYYGRFLHLFYSHHRISFKSNQSTNLLIEALKYNFYKSLKFIFDWDKNNDRYKKRLWKKRF